MWPTYFIPFLSEQPPLVAYACGRRTGRFTDVDLNYDVGSARTGDLELVCLSWNYSTGSPGAENITLPVNSTGWRALFDERNPSTLYSTSRVEQAVFWRIKQAGDIQFDATFLGRDVVLTYSLYAFSNPDTADPFGLLARGLVAENGGFGRHRMAMDLRIGGAENVLLSFVPYARVNADLRDWPTTGDPEFINRCYAAQSDIPTEYYTTRLIWQPASTHQANNLLLHSESSTGWTANLVTIVAGPTNTFSAESNFTARWGRFTQTAATGEHYVYQDVELEAGKTYVFWGHFARTESGRNYLAYVKPDASTHGVLQGTFNISDTVFVGTEVTVGDHFWFQGERNGNNNRSSSLFGIYITPSATGTYRLMVGTADSTATGFSMVGNTGYASAIDFVACTEVPSRFHLPAYVKTTTAPVTGGIGTFTLSQDLSGVSVADAGRALAFELRRAGSAHQQAYLLQPWGAGMPSSVLTDDRLSWSTTEQFYTGSFTGAYTTTCSRINYEGGGNGALKYYFEVTLDTYGTASANPYIAFGITCGSGAAHNIPDSEIAYQYGDLGGEFSYNSDGKFGDNGTFTTVDAAKAWVAGDVLGCALDLDGLTVKFYRNGTEVKSCTIPSAYQTQAWQPHLVILGQNLSTSNYKMTGNFKGPFSSKPSGYVAWDWANEV